MDDDNDVLRRAYTELEEEVQLKREHLCLVAQGRPLLVAIEGRLGNGKILVHPVLFDLVQPYHGPPLDESVLNWENVDIRWMSLEALNGVPVVPRLVETARRTLRVEARRQRATAAAAAAAAGEGKGGGRGGRGGERGREWPPAVEEGMEVHSADSSLK